jgi:hypothetical protein
MNEEQYKKMLIYFRDIKHNSYMDMGELAELETDEQADHSDECKLMDYALKKIIRYGSGIDLAEAIKLYVAYIVAAKMISLPR